VTGHSVLGQTLTHMGQMRLARSHLEQAIAAYSVQQHEAYILLDGIDIGVFSLAFVSHTLWYLGYPDQALAQAQAAITLSNSLSHPFGQAAALSYLTMLYQMRREWDAVQSTAQIALRFCVEHDFPYYIAWANLMQGWALAEQDQVEAGIARMEQGLHDLQALGAGLRRPYYLCLLAAAYGKVGRAAEALSLVDDALAQAHEQQQFLYEAELWLVQGELLQAQGATGEVVEECLYKAIELAQQQEVRSIELRSTITLAGLWQSQGRSQEALQSLAKVYGWFTEGFETADLRETKTMLEGLE